jgi:soluble lytic murein transglycosylase
VSGATAKARRRSGGSGRGSGRSGAPRRAASGGRSRAARGRRRFALVVAIVLGVTVAALVAARGPVEDAVLEITLPLKHEDIIRQQARDKNLDPELIAAVIYQESKFQDRTSQAGARGVMQILPSTADYIARKSGGTEFVQGDLADPQINISYGSWYLRYLLDHYDGNERLAIAAYNAGQTNVNKWVAQAGGPDEFDRDEDIPFAETRAYVASVETKKREYRKNYARELGIRD